MLSPSLRLRTCSHESDVLPLPCRTCSHARRLLFGAHLRGDANLKVAAMPSTADRSRTCRLLCRRGTDAQQRARSGGSRFGSWRPAASPPPASARLREVGAAYVTARVTAVTTVTAESRRPRRSRPPRRLRQCGHGRHGGQPPGGHGRHDGCITAVKAARGHSGRGGHGGHGDHGGHCGQCRPHSEPSQEEGSLRWRREPERSMPLRAPGGIDVG